MHYNLNYFQVTFPPTPNPGPLHSPVVPAPPSCVTEPSPGSQERPARGPAEVRDDDPDRPDGLDPGAAQHPRPHPRGGDLRGHSL